MRMEPRLLPLMFHIDTQLINSKQNIESVNKFEKWFADGVILINMSGRPTKRREPGPINVARKRRISRFSPIRLRPASTVGTSRALRLQFCRPA
jgi:hypothetical protein